MHLTHSRICARFCRFEARELCRCRRIFSTPTPDPTLRILRARSPVVACHVGEEKLLIALSQIRKHESVIILGPFAAVRISRRDARLIWIVVVAPFSV
jgi:hypothetical protein